MESAIKCPLCLSTRLQLKSVLDFVTIARAYKKSFNVEIENSAVDKIYRYQCSQCHLVFFHPAIVGDEFFYRELAKNDWYYMEDKWEFKQALGDILPSNSVLEIGCGSGNFLKKLKSRDVKRIVGIDLNENALNRAKKEGLEVYKATVKEFANKQNQKFDAVCFFQVLEHIPNPYFFLKTSIKLLKPGGKLIIGVPNSEGFLKEIRFPLLNVPPHHLTRWNIEVFSYLEKTLPLKLEKYSCESIAEYHVSWYMRNKLLNYIEKILGKRITDFLDEFIVTRKLISDFLRYFLLSIFLITGATKGIKGHTLYVKYSKE